MENDNHRVLLFDIDGTLLDPAEQGRLYFSQALQEVYGTAGPLEDFSMAGKTDWQIVTELMSLAGLPEEQIEAGREATFAAYARAISEADLASKMKALPGVHMLLDGLSQRTEYALGLVTGNVREAVPHKLRAVGIDPAQFTFGAYGSERLHRNDLPGLAISRLEAKVGYPIERGQVLVIGDTSRDIDCARHAGVKVLAVATGQPSAEELVENHPDYVLNDLTDTDEVMKIFQTF